MPETTEVQPIIIIKKKAKHAGHHGGAWKVAYADFVTAMMALFIVLWLLSSSEDVKKAVAGYFYDPNGQGKQIGSGLAGSGESLSVAKTDMGKLKERLEQSLKQMPAFEKIKNQVHLTVTGEGLRIELLESAKGMFFESGRPAPSEHGRELLVRLAEEVGRMQNPILIEGHTDSHPFNGGGSYTNWELSADRANAARRLMQEHGLRADQVTQVRGFADQRLRVKDAADPSNRRISVVIQYNRPQGAPEQPGHEGKAEHEPKESAAHGTAAASGHHEQAEPAKKPEHAPAAESHSAAPPTPAAAHH